MPEWRPPAAAKSREGRTPCTLSPSPRSARPSSVPRSATSRPRPAPRRRPPARRRDDPRRRLAQLRGRARARAEDDPQARRRRRGRVADAGRPLHQPGRDRLGRRPPLVVALRTGAAGLSPGLRLVPSQEPPACERLGFPPTQVDPTEPGACAASCKKFVRSAPQAPISGYLERVATTASGVTAAHELDELYRLHAAEVFRYAYAVLGNRADAEDVTQTTFVNALRALERGEKPRKPTNWLITIAHNLIRQRFRQQQARPLEVELDRDVAVEEDADDGPSIDELVRALQRIPPTQRAGARPARAGGPLLRRDRRAARRLPVGARGPDLPRPPLARRGAREPRHLRSRRARPLARDRRPPRPQGAPAPRRPHRRVRELRQGRRAEHQAPARVQGARAAAAAVLADVVQGRAERRRRDRPADDRSRRRRRHGRRCRRRRGHDEDRDRPRCGRGRGRRRVRGRQGGAGTGAAPEQPAAKVAPAADAGGGSRRRSAPLRRRRGREGDAASRR